MTQIKFGTDGWRAIIAQDFTVDNVIRVAEATAQWVNVKSKTPSVVVGHDCRFGGQLFAEAVAKVLATKNVKVYLAKGFVSTPMVSLGTVNKKADLGVIITASHNPPSYNGYKLKGSYGGPLLPAQVEEIENQIQDKPTIDVEKIDLKTLVDKKQIEYIDLETMYCDHAEKNFDLPLIRKSGLKLAYDAMYGAGQNVIKRLLPDTTLLHCDNNPGFMGQAPEPIHKNLTEFANLIKSNGKIDLGLATDGDADRIGLYDGKGNFIDSHHIILLLIQYLFKHKGMKGKVVVAFSTTPKIKKMCQQMGLECITTKIGFKYICEYMVTDDVLLGGEESGGIAIKGHIPERDGIWMGLVILEYMAKSGKTLNQLIDEVYKEVGSFSFERIDLHLTEDVKQRIIGDCKANKFVAFGPHKVSKMDDLDGWKYFFNDDEWLMIRASGTEPVLRTYAESSSSEKAFAILKDAQKTLLN